MNYKLFAVTDFWASGIEKSNFDSCFSTGLCSAEHESGHCAQDVGRSRVSLGDENRNPETIDNEQSVSRVGETCKTNNVKVQQQRREKPLDKKQKQHDK